MKKRVLLGILGLGVAGWGLLRIRQRLVSRWMDLPPAQYQVRVERNLRIPMPDDVTLVADHYFPAASGNFPTILIRTPYGRTIGAALFFMAPRFAERGYHVITQDTRGRAASEGTFDPFRHEAADGQATLDWIVSQPWCNGVVGMWGASYLGYVQWALASSAPPALKAIVPIISSAQFVSLIRPAGRFNLDTMLRLTFVVDALDIGRRHSLPAALWRLMRQEQILAPAMQHLPLIETDTQAVGTPVAYYRDWLTHPLTDAYWQAMDHRHGLKTLIAAPHLIAGWYDIFLGDQLADYLALKAAGKAVYLTVGPWYHFDANHTFATMRESLDWFEAHLKGDHSRLRRHAVRIYVMGANEWREMEDWPPPAHMTHYFLQSGQQLSIAQPDAHALPDRYGYNPADPTPIVGGTIFHPQAGARDNRPLEARADVLCYTTAPLTRDTQVIGPVRLELYVRSNLTHTDFFGRLCDVHPDGRSMNICDGLFAIEPGQGEPQPDGSLRIEIDMWATAHRFRQGHRIRLQVSSGAHPRWVRNLGTGEPLATGRGMVVAEQEIYHDQAHPSALVLPLVL